jgi:hypothetical protein
MVRTLYVLSIAVLAASNAQAASVKEVFEKYNLLGNFAWDCSKAPSVDSNWYFINRLLDLDHVQRDFMTGPSTRQWVIVITKASEVRPNEISVTGQITGRIAGRSVENEVVDGVWRIEPNRMQQWSSSLGGKLLISAGRLGSRDLPWINKCGAPG